MHWLTTLLEKALTEKKEMRKAEISINMVIAALIALIVFVVLVLVFRSQLTEVLKPLTEAIKNVGSQAGEIGK